MSGPLKIFEKGAFDNCSKELTQIRTGSEKKNKIFRYARRMFIRTGLKMRIQWFQNYCEEDRRHVLECSLAMQSLLQNR